MPESKKNVADYRTIKDLLMIELYDFVRNVNTLQNPKILDRQKEYEKTLNKIRQNAFFLRMYGVPSKNISSKVGLKLQSLAMNKTIDQEDVDTDEYKVEYVEDPDLHRGNVSKLMDLCLDISDDMGETGFLDTRMEDETVETDEDIPERYR